MPLVLTCTALQHIGINSLAYTHTHTHSQTHTHMHIHTHIQTHTHTRISRDDAVYSALAYDGRTDGQST